MRAGGDVWEGRRGRVGGLARTCGRAGGDVWEGRVCEALSRPGRVGGLAGTCGRAVCVRPCPGRDVWEGWRGRVGGPCV